MGGANSHLALIPLPSKQRRAAITQALSRKFDKRKKLSKTLKRIIHYNSKHPNKDQCKQFRDLLSTWTTVELSRLVEIYESTITLHQVAAEASAARPPMHSVTSDLSSLVERQTCTDITVVHHGRSYPCHMAILSNRSSFFRKLLNQMVGSSANDSHSSTSYPLSLDITHSSPIDDTEIFIHFLHYLYSDLPPPPQLITSADFDIVCQQFGVNKSVTQMLRNLHDGRDDEDVTLVFLRTAQQNPHGITDNVRLAQYTCHSAVLASRSKLLCNLIERRRCCPASSNSTDDTKAVGTEIILDDAVVSHKYATLLLKIMYQDQLDLSLVNSQSSTITSSSLCEAQAIVSGRSNITLLEETMELHHIGNFLELPVLIEKCEDYIIQNISPENLSTILTWSQESSGSRWVYREALQYIQDNFMQICQCPALYSLDESTLAKVLQSDFLQASELDVLKAIINWSEHQLIRQLESREPNLVTHTAHSLARKGVKSKDLDDTELREISSPLMLHVRQSHLLASNSDVFMNAVKRGLIGSVSMSPRHDLAASEPVLNQHTTHAQRGAWVPSSKANIRYEIPRAYMPFYDVARSMLDERTKDMSESDVVHLRRPSRPNSRLADTFNHNHNIRHSTVQNVTRIQEEISQLQYGPEDTTEVVKRTQELLQTGIVVQALQTCWDKSSVLKQVCLWAVREMDYPDQIIYTIKNSTISSQTTDQHHSDHLARSLVPDLAPERLILQHGLSTSFENLTIHSVNSSPDVTLLSVRSYRNDVSRACFPDVTLHSHHSSSSEGDTTIKGAKGISKLASSLQRVRKRSLPRRTRASTVSCNLPPRHGSSDKLPAAIRKHKHVLSDRSATPPDVVERSPPASSPDLMPTTLPRQSHHNPHSSNISHHYSTLDSVPHRSSRLRTEADYHTPPTASHRRQATLRQRNSGSHDNLLFSSLTRNMNRADYDSSISLLASAGPPPDIAPHATRGRVTGTSTPPDITSSPNNTWQAML